MFQIEDNDAKSLIMDTILKAWRSRYDEIQWGIEINKFSFRHQLDDGLLAGCKCQIYFKNLIYIIFDFRMPS